MKFRFLAVAAAVVLPMVMETSTVHAGYGCRYAPQTVTIVHPVVQHETVVVKPVVATPVIATPVIATTIVAPSVAVVPKAIKVPQGGILRLKANFLGKDEGHVILNTGSVTMNCQIIEWDPQFVIVRLPDLAVTQDTDAKLVIATSQGDVKRHVPIIIAPTPDVEVVPSQDFIPKAPTEVLSR